MDDLGSKYPVSFVPNLYMSKFSVFGSTLLTNDDCVDSSQCVHIGNTFFTLIFVLSLFLLFSPHPLGCCHEP